MFWKKKNQIDWGTLRSFKPVSSNWGFERGTPIDRYYIERFINENRSRIKGNCLELLNDVYTKGYGTGVTVSDILDINDKNKDATIIGDLSVKTGSVLKDSFYDCIILTQVLQHIYHAKDAVANCYKSLKPGGSIMITVPFVMMYHEEPHDCWRFTPYSLGEIVKEAGFTTFNVSSYGNIISTIAFLEGMAVQDVTTAELDHYDSKYLVSVCCVAEK